jgi:hypothetical protein
MNFLENLAAQRQKLLDGIDANEGDINLRIFEDFYPDEAHFIYELLQNAEDAGATEVAFELTAQACYFEHNGSRQFNERDIRSITGIFNSSKKDNPDKIGKFGVGFKSVYVYTETPIVYSSDFSFKILKLVLPQAIVPKPGLGTRTRFEFPFNSPKKDAKAAFSEVKSGLRQLSETTLLFLNNLRHIRWTIGDQEGAVFSKAHSGAHIEILKLADGKESLSSHWLRFSIPVDNINQFSAPAEGVERQKVSVAFELSFVGDTKFFDAQAPLAKQLKIKPALKGKVSVFFPAEKETSGLRFHLHALFIPELSRASIKNSPENAPLFGQIARVAAGALHEIKELGLLTGEFLAVLPNNDDPLPERYGAIRKAIIDEMKAQSLVPTYGGGFAPATRLLQARAAMKVLLSDDDLVLVTERRDQPTWAIGATQRNSNQDRFLSSLGLEEWDAQELKELLENRARADAVWSLSVLDPAVKTWLSAKPVDWLQALYALLYRHCEDSDDYGDLAEASIVRLVDGTFGTAKDAYFQTGPASSKDPLPRVDETIFTAGTKKVQQEDARKFLYVLGVRVPGELEEITLLLKSRYGQEGDSPADAVYVADLKKMIAFAETHPDSRAVFSGTYIFQIDSPKFGWGTEQDVYIDTPYLRTGLKVLYDSAEDQDDRCWPLSSWYLTCGIPADKVAHFAELVGCKREFDNLYEMTGCQSNPRWSYLSQAPGMQYGTYVNLDYALTAEALKLLHSRQVAASQLVWSSLCRVESRNPAVLLARFQRTQRGGPHYAHSQLVCFLRDLAWVPLIDGEFVRPRAATQAKLHKGFAVDAAFKWLEYVEFGSEEKKKAVDTAARAQRRAEIGFESEEALQRALAFSRLPEDEQERMLEKASLFPMEPVELPERHVSNLDMRQKRVRERARETPDKETVVKQRSVAVGYEATKAEAKLYLVEQYTNSNQQMICQACKGELPFKLPTGAYFFEAVEIIADGPKRYRETFLALCPNHAAAYQYANAQRNVMQELVATASGNEIDLALGGVETTLYFTQMHLADVKACLASSDDDPDSMEF